MDSAKPNTSKFFPYCMDISCDIMVDDIFQGGTILRRRDGAPKTRAQIHRRLNTISLIWFKATQH